MNLQDIYDQLTHGELAQVSLGDTNTGKMTEENKAKVIGHINLGLMDLYKKFRLKENEIYVMLHPERNVYYIDNKYISDLCLEDMHFNPKTDTTVLPPRECPPNADVRNAYGDVDKDGVIPEDPEIEVLERNGIERVTTHGFEYLQQPPDPRSKTPVDNSPPRKYLIEIEGFGFEDDLLKIERIYTPYDQEIILNKRDDPHSIRTPEKNTIVLPRYHYRHGYNFSYNHENLHDNRSRSGAGYGHIEELNVYGGYGHQYARHKPNRSYPSHVHGHHGHQKQIPYLRVVYRASHKPIDHIVATGCDSSDIPIALPDSHMHALLLFIGSRVLNRVGMVNEFHAGNSYSAKYEAECQRLRDENYEVDNIGEETKFEDAGWR